MTDLSRLNPFSDVIEKDPRKIHRSVSGLNDDILENTLDTFQDLDQGEPPRLERKLDCATFLVSPAPGFGKSHMIGRLFAELAESAVLVNIKPFEDDETCWKSILNEFVNELHFPPGVGRGFASEGQPSQIEDLAAGIFRCLAAAQIAEKGNEKQKRLAARLKRGELGDGRQHKGWVKYIKENLPRLVARLDNHLGGNLESSGYSWLSVLFVVAYRPRHDPLNVACYDWLRGGSVDRDEAKAIGLRRPDNPAHDISSTTQNGICRGRVLDFCHLAAFHKPFLLCFDQTENYRKDPNLSQALASAVSDLVNIAPGQLTIVTANQEVWEKRLKPHWEDAQVQRLCDPHETMSGLNRSQAEELIRLRIEDVPGLLVPAGFSDTAWLDEVVGSSRLGVRDFLQTCKQRWAGSARQKVEEPTLEDHFQRYYAELETEPGSTVFDGDALLWMVMEVAQGLHGIKAEKYRAQRRYLRTKWTHGDKHVFFGFEDGNHWRTWQAVARESDRHFAAHPGCKVVMFRTAEQLSIPGKWKIKKEIDDAKQRHMHVLVLDRPQMLLAYAARRLYLNVGEGNITGFEVDEALSFAQSKLEPVWRRVLSPAPFDDKSPNANGDPPPELIEEVRTFLEVQHYSDMKELNDKFGERHAETVLLKAVSSIKEISISHIPNNKVFIWRP